MNKRLHLVSIVMTLVHRSTECRNMVSATDRRKILVEKKHRFNCTGARNRAADCRSQMVCQQCKKKHHTSICDALPGKKMMVAKGESKVIYPVVVVKARNVICRALLDTGAGSSRGCSMHSYITIFATLLHLLQTEVGICIQIYVTIFATLLHLLQTEVGVCIHI